MGMNNFAYRPVLILAPGVLAGAEKVVLTGLIALHKIGLNPLIVIIRETRSPQFAEDFKNILPPFIEYTMIDSVRALDFELPSQLAIVLKQESLPVVLHSHGFKALIASYFARKKRAHIHTHHGNTGHTFKVRIYEKIAMTAMKTCDRVVAVSLKMKEELIISLRPFKKIIAIENMLSLDNAAKIRSARTDTIRTSTDIINLIYVGRLSPEKGLIQFLKCLAEHPKKNRFHLTILGDGIERSLIEKFISENQLSEMITMHGFVADPSQFFITPDVLIMPSLREGLPMTLIEALASGIPVIANNVGAIASLVVDGKNGCFSKDFSHESWNDVLESTILNYMHWKMNAEKDAIMIEERFSANLWAIKTQAAYQEILKI
jgi:glycosyltransferase involved in cell wall biosynthesis